MSIEAGKRGLMQDMKLLWQDLFAVGLGFNTAVSVCFVRVPLSLSLQSGSKSRWLGLFASWTGIVCDTSSEGRAVTISLER